MGFNRPSNLVAALAILASAAAQAACDPSTGLRFICGMTNAEDLVQVPRAPWIIASGLAEGNRPNGHLYLVNTRSLTASLLLPGHISYRQDTHTYASCPGRPDESRFSTNGLDVRAGPGSEHILYAVHHGERESIEIFRLSARADPPKLTWVGCVVFPAGVSGNGVAALPGNAFAASNFFSTRDPNALRKLMAGRPEGGLLIWRPRTGWETVPGASAISGDNGIASTRDGKHIFVAGWGDQTVVRLSLDGTTKARSVLKTRFHTDNLRWGSDGFLYAAGQRETVKNLLGCAPGTSRRCTSAFSVLRIDPSTLRAVEVVRHPGGVSFGAGSTALAIGDEYWLGTPHGDRIAIIEAKPSAVRRH